MVIVALVTGAVALLALQRAVGLGLPARAFTLGEAFVFGHWPFMFLGAAVLLLGGGRDWATLARFHGASLRTAAALTLVGLVTFVLGGWLGTLVAGRKNESEHRETPPRDVLPIALVLTILGASAALLNAPLLRPVTWAERSGALLIATELLVPAAVLAAAVALRPGRSCAARATAYVAVVLSICVLTTAWSRRPLIVAVVAVLLAVPTLRRGWVARRRVLLLVPLMALLAVAAYFWRYEVWHPGMLNPGVKRDAAGVRSTYSRSLWLETSSFSALVLTIEEFGLTTFRGGGSLAMPLVFWIPRSVFAAKPSAFELGDMLGTPYSIPPSIYGEVLVNLTVAGLVPFMVALGFLARRIDRAGTAPATSDGARALYLVLVLDAVFVVRGSFHTMVTPMIVHGLVPLVLLRGYGGLVQLAAAAFRSGRMPPRGERVGGPSGHPAAPTAGHGDQPT